MKSIIQRKKECYITGSTSNLHKHHIFEGIANRELSEKYGLWVWLRYDWHNMSDYGVHFNKELDIKLKIIAQRKFEEEYPKLNFLKIFRKELFIGGKENGQQCRFNK